MVYYYLELGHNGWIRIEQCSEIKKHYAPPNVVPDVTLTRTYVEHCPKYGRVNEIVTRFFENSQQNMIHSTHKHQNIK